jgi:hypothetical protein
MQSGITLRQFHAEDRAAVDRLCRRHGLAGLSEALWEHLWESNPASAEAGPERPRGWVLDDVDAGIVGYFGNIPSLYAYKGRRLRAGVAGEWVVDGAFRKSSLQLVSAYFKQKDVDLLIQSTANAVSAKIYRAFRSCEVPSHGYDTPLFWICDPSGFAAALLQKRGYARSTALLKPILAAGLATVQAIRRSRATSRHDAPDVLAGFDERFDTFWTDLCAARPNTLLCFRRLADLEWHFKSALENESVWIFAEGSPRMRAYAIFRKEDAEDIGLKRVRLVDWQSLDGTPETAVRLVTAACRQAVETGVHIVEALGFPAACRQRLQELRPFRRVLPSWPFYYRAQDRAIEADLRDAAAWHACAYDGDASL